MKKASWIFWNKFFFSVMNQSVGYAKTVRGVAFGSIDWYWLDPELCLPLTISRLKPQAHSIVKLILHKLSYSQGCCFISYTRWNMFPCSKANLQMHHCSIFLHFNLQFLADTSTEHSQVLYTSTQAYLSTKLGNFKLHHHGYISLLITCKVRKLLIWSIG